MHGCIRPDRRAVLDPHGAEQARPRTDHHPVPKHHVGPERCVLVDGARDADVVRRRVRGSMDEGAARSVLARFMPSRHRAIVAQPSADSSGGVVRMSPRSTSVHPTSVVSPDAELGKDVVVGPHAVIGANVVVGEGCFVDSHVLLGAPTADYYRDPVAYSPRCCTIGAGAVIRSHSIVYHGAEVSEEFESGHHVTIREGTRIGRAVRVGTRSDVQGDLRIGDFARLHSNVFVAQRSTIEEFVWLFPNVMLANDPHPPSDTCTVGPTIRRYAVVAAGATVFPGVDVGEGAVVGAMALVRDDVPAGTVVVGIPARVTGNTADVTCRDGRLDRVYPWHTHFRRGYPEDAFDEA